MRLRVVPVVTGHDGATGCASGRDLRGAALATGPGQGLRKRALGSFALGVISWTGVCLVWALALPSCFSGSISLGSAVGGGGATATSTQSGLTFPFDDNVLAELDAGAIKTWCTEWVQIRKNIVAERSPDPPDDAGMAHPIFPGGSDISGSVPREYQQAICMETNDQFQGGTQLCAGVYAIDDCVKNLQLGLCRKTVRQLDRCAEEMMAYAIGDRTSFCNSDPGCAEYMEKDEGCQKTVITLWPSGTDVCMLRVVGPSTE